MRRFWYFTFIFLALLAAMTLSLVAATSPAPSNEATETSVLAQGKTVLFVGITEKPLSAEVILIGHIDSDGKTMKLLQIPSRAYTASGTRVGELFTEGVREAREAGNDPDACYFSGIHTLAAFLEAALGITIDNSAALTDGDFGALIDTLGGIPITLPHSLDYTDSQREIDLHLPQGNGTADGKTACALILSPELTIQEGSGSHDAQKFFMGAFFSKLKYHSTPTELFTFVHDAYNAILTDFTLGDAVTIGAAMITAKSEAMWYAPCTGERLTLADTTYEVIPKDTLISAAAWLEGRYNEEAEHFCGEDATVRALYTAPAATPFAPKPAEEDKE